MSVRTSALAAVTQPDGSTALQTFPVPPPADDAALLEVEASGVCGTDVALVRDRALELPTILGHHVVGRVAALGASAASRWNISEGDLVALQEYLPCHACRWCRSGQYRMCDRSDLWLKGRRFGTVPTAEAPGLWGGNAQFLHLPAETLVHPLPGTLDPARAVWVLPLANAFDWTIEAGRLAPGESVVVVGPGQHGLTCVVAAREAGANGVVVVGLPGDEPRLELARLLGADHVVAVDPAAAAGAVGRALDGGTADVVVDTSGAGPDLLPALLGMTGKLSRVVLAGLTRGVAGVDLEVVTRRALSVVGVRGRSLAAVDRAIASLFASDHPLDSVPTRVLSLAETGSALNPEPGVGTRAVHTVVRPGIDQ